MILFRENGKGTCQGDNGGTFIFCVDGRQTTCRATSFAVECAGPTYSSVSVRNLEYPVWIWETIEPNDKEEA